MKVAIIHYWLVGMRGGEKVLEALCRMFPDAVIFTHVYDPSSVSDTIRRHKVHTTFVGRLPFARRLYQKYLPLMPLALEELDLTEFDLIISSESGPAKGIIPGPRATHLCYIHSPMRYIWDHYYAYKREAGPVSRLVMPLLCHKLRGWDVTSATRVDTFIANSSHVASRVEKYYRRPAAVVHPPVDVAAFSPVEQSEVGEFYLWVGELVGYKRPDLAVDAFNRLGKPLVVIGNGPQLRSLQRFAKSNITFLGKAPFAVLKEKMARCRALIFPGEEDFGIVPVEVMASGRPVIAYGKGGALDTVRDGVTGVLFDNQTTEGLMAAVARFEASDIASFGSSTLVAHARKFSEAQFRAGIAAALADYGIDTDVVRERVEYKRAAS